MNKSRVGFFICPHCKSPLREVNIYSTEDHDSFQISIDEEGRVYSDVVENIQSYPGDYPESHYLCPECGQEFYMDPESFFTTYGESCFVEETESEAQQKHSVLGSLAIEGLAPSKEAQLITEKFSNGDISENEAVDSIKKLHGVQDNTRNS